MKTSTFPIRICVVVAALVLPAPIAFGQASTSGIIEGRVLNARTGDYIEKARVIIEGTALEAFTDSAGYYRLAHVPVGPVSMKVFSPDSRRSPRRWRSRRMRPSGATSLSRRVCVGPR